MHLIINNIRELFKHPFSFLDIERIRKNGGITSYDIVKLSEDYSLDIALNPKVDKVVLEGVDIVLDNSNIEGCDAEDFDIELNNCVFDTQDESGENDEKMDFQEIDPYKASFLFNYVITFCNKKSVRVTVVLKLENNKSD